MNFYGIQKTSLVNYPGKICTVLFTGKCNLRCKFCYNKDLVDVNPSAEILSENAAINIIKSRSRIIDAVTVSGGEPSIYPELIDFLIRLKKETRLSVKLDTNGINHESLDSIFKQKLVDYVALDIKTSPEKYELLTGVAVDFKKITKTIKSLKTNNIEFELRTTAIPGYFSKEDIQSIKAHIGEVKTYNLQQFVSENTLDTEFESLYSFPHNELDKFRNEILTFSTNCTIKGI